jgi:hypothetical protein
MRSIIGLSRDRITSGQLGPADRLSAFDADLRERLVVSAMAHPPLRLVARYDEA